MKKILFGIALILFGLNMTYVGTISGGGLFEVLGLGCSFVGILLSIVGYFSKSEKSA